MGEDIDDNGDDDDDDDDEDDDDEDDDDDDDENCALRLLLLLLMLLLLLLLPPPGTRVCGGVPGDGGILGNGSDKQGRGEAMGVSGIPLPSTAPLLSLLSRRPTHAGAPTSCTSGSRCGGEREAHTSWVALEGQGQGQGGQAQGQSPPIPQRRPILPSPHANSSLQGVGSPESAAPSNRPPSWLQHLQRHG